MPFRLSETLIEERVWNIEIVNDVTGDPSATALVAADIQIHKYGGGWVNITNAPVADGTQAGAWIITLTAAELDTAGPIWIRVVKAGVRTFLDWDMVATASLRFGFEKDEINAALRVFGFVATDDTTGNPSAAALVAADIFFRKYGGAWTNPAAAPINVSGQIGAWEVPLTAAELNTAGPMGYRLTKPASGVRDMVGWIRVDDATVLGGGGGVGLGEIISITPPQADIAPALGADVGDQWTPLAVLLELRTGDSLYIVHHNIYKGVRTVVYDPTHGFSPLFNRSSIGAGAPNPGTGAARIIVSLLPAGGWKHDQFYLSFISGQEMAGAAVPLTRWDPVNITVEPHLGDKIFGMYYSNIGRWQIYGPDGTEDATLPFAFTPFYAKTSSISAAAPNPGTGAPRWAMSILPRSGWQRSFDLELVTGIEMPVL